MATGDNVKVPFDNSFAEVLSSWRMSLKEYLSKSVEVLSSWRMFMKEFHLKDIIEL